MTEINFSDTDRKKLLFFLLNRQEKTYRSETKFFENSRDKNTEKLKKKNKRHFTMASFQ